MRVNISYDDVCIELHDASSEEVRDLVFALKAPPPLIFDKPKRGRPRKYEEVATLNEAQTQTWSYLVTNATEERGIYPLQIAKRFNLSPEGARQRLIKLARMGIAYFDEQGGCHPGAREE